MDGMSLKLDKNKSYAIALEGGGARGGYEVGVWKALDEAGIAYSAVSGTSVGALNGALMTMRDLPRAIDCWENIRLEQVIKLQGDSEEELKRLLAGEAELEDIQQLLPQAVDLIRSRGLDISPLREWLRQVADPQAIKSSDVEFFVVTLSLTDMKALEVKVNELPEEEIWDMLMASAYHPSFRMERLGGKYYADGGFVDTIPIHALIENGYRDIIAVRLPGMGVERRFKIPDDADIRYVGPALRELGPLLNFDAKQAKLDMKVGYMDGLRLLYGLEGRWYYLRRSMSEREALDMLLDGLEAKAHSLRQSLEWLLPHHARRLDLDHWDYYGLLVALMEEKALEQDLPWDKVYLDRDFFSMVLEAGKLG